MRTTTIKEDRAFADAVASGSLLEDAVEWIGDNIAPEDVFSEDALQDWAERNNWVPGS